MMHKLNLANLAQDELKKEEAQKAKGGVWCPCGCICSCPVETRYDIKFDDKLDEAAYIKNVP